MLEDDLITKHTVSFNTDGGTEIAPVEVEDGQLLTAPEAPVKEVSSEKKKLLVDFQAFQ